ncbi:uncharacterized protein LOC134856914 [Symsagittifera roscoffensis]|uniref:uncharacterized protein LOC134856914 n=1 Tax=Symsagittifera roscoffensis TaxID=84072 RepID=UPI00307CA751
MLPIIYTAIFMIFAAKGFWSGKVSERREYLAFLFPDPNDSLGLTCLQRSNWFCLTGYWQNFKLSDRQPLSNDTSEFIKWVEPAYEQINWFSFKPEDAEKGGCCTYQVNMYMEQGQKNGLSPREYAEKTLQFSDYGEKNLAYVKSRWNDKLCANVISQVGFGYGSLKLVGGKGLTKKFVLPPLGGSKSMYLIHGATLKRNLSFSYVMTFIVCKAKPELCPDDFENEIAESSSGQRVIQMNKRGQ